MTDEDKAWEAVRQAVFERVCLRWTEEHWNRTPSERKLEELGRLTDDLVDQKRVSGEDPEDVFQSLDDWL